MFSCEICKIFKNTFFYTTTPVAPSGNGKTFYRLSIFYYHNLAKCSVFNLYFDWMKIYFEIIEKKKGDIMKICFIKYKIILIEWKYLFISYEFLFLQHFGNHNWLCNRNMLNINLHSSNSAQKFRIGFPCTISSMNQKMIKFWTNEWIKTAVKLPNYLSDPQRLYSR